MNKFLRSIGALLLSLMLLTQHADAQVLITVGNGTVNLSNTTYPAPYGNWYWGARHQFLVRASELLAAGATPGFISSLAFDVATVQGTALSDFTIRMGTTTDSVLSSANGFNANTTQTFTVASYTETSGWNTHAFATNFFWDGSSNLIVETCFNNTSYTNNAVVNQTNVGFNASIWYNDDAAGVCANPTSFSSAQNRPNMRFGFLPNSGRDAAATALVSPASPAIGGSVSQVILQISNFAADPITSGSVGYSVNGSTPVIESWTGSLATGQSGTHTFQTPITLPTSGLVNVSAWVTNPNGLGADINTSNDTINSTLCLALPSGVYTVGASGLADYPTLQAAVDAVNCGGIAGAVTFSIEPGTYYGSYVLNGVVGASVTNQLTFTSLTGLASDVVLIHDTSAAATNKSIFTVNNTAGVTFNGLTLRRTQNQTSGTFANILATGADNMAITSCVIDETIPLNSVSFSSNGVLVNGGSSLIITGNQFSGFYYSIYLSGPTANDNYEEFNSVSANIINNYRYGVYGVNQSLMTTANNEFNNAATTFGYGVYMSRVVAANISSNKITGTLASGGIYVFNPNDSVIGETMIVNNVVSGNSVITGACYGIYVSASFGATSTPSNPRDKVSIYHNTVNITFDLTSTSTFGLIHITGGTVTTPAWNMVNMLNNQMVGFAGPNASLSTNMTGAFFTNDSLVAVLSSNNNNFFMADAAGVPAVNALVRNGTGPVMHATLASWTTASNQDAASVTLNPGFTSASLPIPTAGAMNNLGTPIALVPTDILGTQRSATTPDIGAYEYTPSPFDLAAVGIITQGGCAGANQPISVTVRNVGTSTFDFATSPLTIDLNITGPAPQTFSLIVNSDSLQVDSVRTFVVTVNADFTLGGNYTLNASMASTNDGNSLNNTTSRVINVIGAIPTPWVEAFNGTAAPTNITTNMFWSNNIGVLQTGGMRYNVYGSQTSNFRTPIVGPLDTGAVMDFDYKITNWSGWAWPGVATTLGVTDTIKIELSTDCGQTFFLADTITSANHVPSNQYATKRLNLSQYAGQQVIARIIFRQNSGIDVYFDIDNFRIFTPSPVDMGVFSILSPSDGCGLTGTDTVRVRIVNYGTVSQGNFPVSYTVNGGTPVTETITTTMLPGDSLNYTFTATANLGTVGTYQIRAYTGANNDGDFTNDTLGRQVRNYPVVSSLPYLEDFEGTAAGWFAGGNSSSWALGTPSANIINSAASGTKAWATNLSGNFNTGERSWIQSPCFDLSVPGLVTPEVRFNLWYEVGQFDGGANLQYSTDGGANWQVLGTVGSGIQNWYNNGFIQNSGTPAQPGWLGNTGSTTFPGSGGYVEVAHDLSPLIGQSSVIFRVAFYASAFPTPGNGVAVDDFRVFQPLDPVITSVDTMSNDCSVGARTVSAAVFNFSPITSTTLHYRLSPTGTYASAPMTFNATSSRWVGTIPAGTPNDRISYFVTTVDSASLRDTSGVLGYVDDYLQPDAGPDQTITAGSSATLNGQGGTFVGTVGTGTVTNTASGYPAPYGNFYWGARHQFLILASELTAAGVNPGLMKSLAFDVVTANGIPMDAFEIKLGHTTVNDLTSWVAGTTTVYTAASYTDTLGWNVHPFSTPFLWDGISNVVVEVCFQNISWTDNAVVNQTTTTFNSSYWYRADAAGVCGNASNSGSMMQRPNMRIEGGYAFEWKDLSTGTVLTSTSPTFVVSPTATTDYEFRLNDAACTDADTMTVFVQAQMPDVGVIEVLTPNAPQLNQPHTVVVVVKNHGGVAATGFDVAYTVGALEVNRNVVSRTVAPGDTIHHIFALDWTPTSGGTNVLCAFTILATDPVPSNDTTCRTYLNVSVEEVNDLVSRVYPNPADQAVNFDFGQMQGNGVLEIRDQLGRVVHTQPVDLSIGSLVEVKTSTYAAGVYNYRFVLNDKVQHGQVMIRR